MELGVLAASAALESQTEPKIPRTYKVSQIDLGNMIDMWESQKKVCGGGSHEDFAKHLLILHKAYCSNYCEAESLQKKVLQALWAEGGSTPNDDAPLARPIKDEPEDDTPSGPAATPQTTTKWLQPGVPLNEMTPIPKQKLIIPTFTTRSGRKVKPTARATAHLKEQQSATDSSAHAHVIEPRSTEEGSLDAGEHEASGELGPVDEMSSESQTSKDPAITGVVNPWPSLRDLPSDAPPDVEDIGEIEEDDGGVDDHAFNSGDRDTEEELGDDDDDYTPQQAFHHAKNLKDRKPHQCMFCFNAFNNVKDLNKHLVTHREKNFSCSDCGKKFATMDYRRKHMIRCQRVKAVKCSLCDQTFKRILAMQVHMREAHAAVRKPHQCTFCPNSFKYIRDLNRHLMFHTREKKYTCENCGKKFATVDYRRKHMTRCKKVEATHLCLMCDETFMSIASMKTHLREAHAAEGSQLQKVHGCPHCVKAFVKRRDLMSHMSKHTGVKPVPCNICSKRFADDRCLRKHMKAHTVKMKNQPTKHSCPNCEQKFNSIRCLKEHIQNAHDGDGLQNLKTHLCIYCGKTFEKARDMKVHLLKHTGERPHVCTECGKGFLRASQLEMHMKTHTGEMPYKPGKLHSCASCEHKFKSIKSLKMHAQEAHDGEGLENLKTQLCIYCGKAFEKSRDMKRHMLCHTGERPYPCTKCSKGFIRDQNLQMHMKIAHSDGPPEKSWLCSECGKAFLYRGSLTLHMVSHRGEEQQRFVCTYCGKKFTELRKLKIHVMMHTGERPFLCTECGKGFTSSYSLKLHMKIHTEGDKLVCTDCGKEFRGKRGLEKHVVRFHAGEKPQEYASSVGEIFVNPHEPDSDMLVNVKPSQPGSHMLLDVKPPQPDSHMIVLVNPPEPDLHTVVEVNSPQPTSQMLVEVNTPEPYLQQLVEVNSPQPTSQMLVEINPPEPDLEQLVEVNSPQPTSHMVVEVSPPQPDSDMVVDVNPPQPIVYMIVEMEEVVVETEELGHL